MLSHESYAGIDEKGTGARCVSGSHEETVGEPSSRHDAWSGFERLKRSSIFLQTFQRISSLTDDAFLVTTSGEAASRPDYSKSAGSKSSISTSRVFPVAIPARKAPARLATCAASFTASVGVIVGIARSLVGSISSSLL